MSAFALLPPAVALVAAMACLRISRGLREAFLLSWLLIGVLTACGTEALSRAHHLDSRGAIVFWGTSMAFLAMTVARDPDFPNRVRRYLARVGDRMANATTGDRVLVAGIIGISIGTFLSSILAPPNTTDSLTYHMGRVLHWATFRSVDFFPTPDLREITFPPLGEYAVLQLQLLSRSDRLANLVQWGACLASLAGVTLICANLGGRGRAQVIAGAIAATIPMGILQASSTQTDYVVASFLVCFVGFGTCPRDAGQSDAVVPDIAMAIALALAIFTKPTSYIVAAPFCLWFILRSRRWRPLLAGVVFIPLVNGVHWVRNYSLFGSPLASNARTCRYSNDPVSPGAVLTNAVRYVAINLATPSDAVNARVTDTIRRLHSRIGGNADDPRFTFCGETFEVTHFLTSDDFAGAPVHLLLGTAMFVTFLIAGRDAAKRFRDRGEAQYVACWLAGTTMFLGYLQWQPWGNRLMLPLVILLSAPIALWADRMRPAVRVASLVALFAYALPVLLFNAQRPLLGAMHPDYGSVFDTPRDRQYFALASEQFYRPVSMIAERIAASGCRRIAVRFEDTDFTYPFEALLVSRGISNVVFEHVGVQNESATLATHNATFCAAISMVADGRDVAVLGPRVPALTLAGQSLGVSLYVSGPQAR